MNTNSIQIILQFNDALNEHDVDGMMRLMTADCVFENTSPPPYGERFEGQADVRAFWTDFFQGSQTCSIEPEEVFAVDDRVVMRWIYRWVGLDGMPGQIRGIDLYRLKDGLIAEKQSYVKG